MNKLPAQDKVLVQRWDVERNAQGTDTVSCMLLQVVPQDLGATIVRLTNSG
jgi:hypothetical protein